MAVTLKISAQVRQETGKNAANRLRKQGFVPGTIYGHGLAPVNISATTAEIAKLQRHRNLLQLDLGDQAAPRNVVVRELQRNYLQDDVIHVDFQEVRLDEKITARVPVVASGIPVGLTGGGVLEQALHFVEVSCLPQDLPEKLVVDVSALKLNDSINVPGLSYPAGVAPAHPDINAVVFHVSPPRAEEVTEADAAAAAAPEPARVEKPKKEEGAAPAAGGAAKK